MHEIIYQLKLLFARDHGPFKDRLRRFLCRHEWKKFDNGFWHILKCHKCGHYGYVHSKGIENQAAGTNP